ncbi:hypothetical protein LSH36_16g01010 [Paralvinella palmiformis]|uniref:protein-tyrosine-phosphatase n=1 Tax=Paralvinella palmiformis TaxID=53620 RepID=A0AAD9KC84_9ANNE|nr:hypothetical protein LSH36_16g01010 [Paralvinella palmiformis]
MPESEVQWWRVYLDKLYRVSLMRLYVMPRVMINREISIYATQSDDTLNLDAHVLCSTLKLQPDYTGVVVIRPPQNCIGTSLIIYKHTRWVDPMVICEVEVKGHLYSDCDANCGYHGDTYSCNAEYGCIAKCDVGKSQESFCKNDCARRTYGMDCKLQCGHCKYNKNCNPVNGSCPEGCRGWYIMEGCSKYIEAARLKSNRLDLTATNSTIHVIWDPVLYEDPDLRQHYGYTISYSREYNMKMLVKNTREEAHSDVTLSDLEHNTYYTVTVVSFRYRDEKSQNGYKTKPKRIKTACIAPDRPQIINYTVTQNWNGTSEIGMLFLKLPEKSGCDRISRVIVSGTERRMLLEGPVRQVTLTLYAAVTYHVTVTAENNERLRTSSPPYPVTVTGTAETLHVNNHVGLYVGIAILAVVIVSAGIVAMLLLVRQRRRRQPVDGNQNHVLYNITDSQSKEPMLQVNLDTNVSCDSLDLMEGVDAEVQEVIYENSRLVENRIKISDLGAYIAKCSDSEKEFNEEFNSLPKGHLAICEAAGLQCNISKNRYRNVKPYDHTRVILKENKGGDYINANYITGYGNKGKKYIATQGPKSATVNDFWHMIWQEDINIVVMLTPVMENLKKQSEPYWPINVGDNVVFGDYHITLTSQNNTAYYSCRTMEISKQKYSRTVDQFQFLAWPDKNRPEHNYSILDFTHRVKRATGCSKKTPILVHCSAGIGRTGTYIALDYLLEQADAEGIVDITTCVHLMRTQRTSLVQTLPQYLFLYEALYHYYLFGYTSISLRKYRQQLEDVTRYSSLPVQLLKYFEALDFTRPIQTSNPDGKKPENRTKNRDMNIIPDDHCRPYIVTVTDYDNNYINAVTVDMHRKRDAVIVTQVPLPNTINDFWSLVLDQDCDLILLLEDLDTYNDQSCQQYWPDVGFSHTYGKIDVTAVGEKSLGADMIMWNMTLKKISKFQTNTEPLSLTFVQYTGWPQETRQWNANKCAGFLDMMAHVETIQHRASAKIFVQCLKGTSRSGIYCAARIVFDRIADYNEIDVPMATQMVVSRRPSFIQSEDEFLILHKLVDKYSEGFQTYINLQ